MVFFVFASSHALQCICNFQSSVCHSLASAAATMRMQIRKFFEINCRAWNAVVIVVVVAAQKFVFVLLFGFTRRLSFCFGVQLACLPLFLNAFRCISHWHFGSENTHTCQQLWVFSGTMNSVQDNTTVSCLHYFSKCQNCFSRWGVDGRRRRMRQLRSLHHNDCCIQNAIAGGVQVSSLYIYMMNMRYIAWYVFTNIFIYIKWTHLK